MSRLAVADASPLIVLGALGRLDLLRHAFERVVVPRTVESECLFDLSFPGAIAVQRALADGSLSGVEDPADLGRVALPLGFGERAAIVLAQGLAATVLLDDAEARAVARRLNLVVVGTLGLLVAARLRGQIPSLASLLEQARGSGFYLSNALVREALRRVGEN